MFSPSDGGSQKQYYLRLYTCWVLYKPATKEDAFETTLSMEGIFSPHLILSLNILCLPIINRLSEVLLLNVFTVFQYEL